MLTKNPSGRSGDASNPLTGVRSDLSLRVHDQHRRRFAAVVRSSE